MSELMSVHVYMDIKILFFENATPTVGEAISEKAIPEDAGFSGLSGTLQE